MNRQSSPFAALTSKEQLERWREFQSIRLPYINGEMDAAPVIPRVERLERQAEPTDRGLRLEDPQKKAATETNAPPCKANQADGCAADRPAHTQQNPPAMSPREQSAWQMTRHQQYDSVINRMRTASQKAKRFEPIR